MLFSLFDWETTGLPIHKKGDLRKQPRGIEFAGIVTDGKRILNTCEFICNPGIDIEPIITKITGLTNDDLRDKPKFKDCIPKLMDFFTFGIGIDQQVRIAHNLSFDRFITECDLNRNGMTLDDVGFNGTKDLPAILCCTVEQLMPLYGFRVRLNDWYNQVSDKEYVQKHRAMDDIMLMHEACQQSGVYEAFAETHNA